jgi:hypothetical protein
LNDEQPNSSTDRQKPCLVYCLTIFTGAFLLFGVQPIIARYILPVFGGSADVWTACMLFFQLLLLAGYAYAHFSVSRFRPRTQAIVHIALIIAALIALPIVPGQNFKPDTDVYPVIQILLLLAVCIGLPYFVLSSTSPLIQAWFSRADPNCPPWRLYALSNTASLIALLSYPFIFEPAFTRNTQANIWSMGLGLYAVLCFASAGLFVRKARNDTPPEKNISETDTAVDITLGRKLLWLALPAGASIELLAVTNKICQDIAVFPFLWVLPLSLYLLSFVICFHHEKFYVRPVFISLFIIGIVATILARPFQVALHAKELIIVYSAMLFFCCMVCHGELYRLRPRPRYLTAYYLTIAAGGAIGGVFVAVIAPLIFNAYSELHVGLLACVLFVLFADRSGTLLRSRRRIFWIIALIAVAVVGSSLQNRFTYKSQPMVTSTRNFFGVVTIRQDYIDRADMHMYMMQHGTTFHGLQFIDKNKRLIPTAYYGTKTGLGIALKNLQNKNALRIGAVGLGVGTIAAYARTDDHIRFYEINPEVERLAKEYFTYLQDCKGKTDIILGDARLSLDSEPPQDFDLLVLDAFSSDAVPVHLLTKEAFEIYLKHLKNKGLIAIHVSTLRLDLKPVIFNLADHFGLQFVWIATDEIPQQGVFDADWILLTKDEKFLRQNNIQAARETISDDYKNIGLWTDDHMNLLQILR